jgi:hypothetical protein
MLIAMISELQIRDSGPMNREAKQRELAELRVKVSQLEHELEPETPSMEPPWPPREFYTAYSALTGFVLGGVGAMASLVFNIIGSLIIGQHPLQLIRVYLTFPLGAEAIDMTSVDSGLALAVGCCLYILTGMVLGMPFELVLSRWFDRSTLGVKFIVVSVMALGLWIINFYAILSWLQPALFGGNWIIADIPWWVAAATHIVFGWTMLFLQPYGRFIYEQPKPQEAS